MMAGMAYATAFAVARSVQIPLPAWFGWALLAGSILFLIGLTLLLVVIARRSRWPDRR